MSQSIYLLEHTNCLYERRSKQQNSLRKITKRSRGEPLIGKPQPLNSSNRPLTMLKSKKMLIYIMVMMNMFCLGFAFCHCGPTRIQWLKNSTYHLWLAKIILLMYHRQNQLKFLGFTRKKPIYKELQA